MNLVAIVTREHIIYILWNIWIWIEIPMTHLQFLWSVNFNNCLEIINQFIKMAKRLQNSRGVIMLQTIVKFIWKNKSELIQQQQQQQQQQNVFNEINDRHLKPLKCWDKIWLKMKTSDELNNVFLKFILLDVSLSPGHLIIIFLL